MLASFLIFVDFDFDMRDFEHDFFGAHDRRNLLKALVFRTELILNGCVLFGEEHGLAKKPNGGFEVARSHSGAGCLEGKRVDAFRMTCSAIMLGDLQPMLRRAITKELDFGLGREDMKPAL